MKKLNINCPKKYQYNGHDITFFKGNNLMVNATEMAKPFGKRPVDWLKTSQSKEIIKELSKVKNITLADLVRVVKGTDNPGTWMHEDVALEFARWLSPAFAIWCNDRIKELMTTGYTKLDTISRKDLARMLLEAEEEKERLAEKAKIQEEKLQIAAPKVEYYDNVLQSQSTYNTNQIAKELGMSAVTLNRKLKELGVQYKQGGTWLLYHKYQNKGFTKTKTHVFVDADGQQHTRMQTVWTEKGRLFIHEILKNDGVKTISLSGKRD